MQAVREGGCDAEVAAAAAERPEEVGVGRLGHVEHVAVGVDELDGQQVVGREAVFRHQPAEPAAEREPGDPRRRDHAAGDGEPVLARGGVELRPGEAALCPHRAGVRVDLGALHLGEVDHHRVVGDRAAGHVVASAADGDVEPGRPCEAHAGGHVGCAAAPDDHGRRPVDEAVVHPARRVVAVVSGTQDTPGDAAGEVVEECGVRRHGHGYLPVCPFRLLDRVGPESRTVAAEVKVRSASRWYTSGMSVDPTPAASRVLRGPDVLADALVRELLEATLVAVLATLEPDGSVHAVPLWLCDGGDAILLATFSRSRKVRNLERDPRATLVLHDSRPGFEVCGVTMRGRAEIVRRRRRRPARRACPPPLSQRAGYDLPVVRQFLGGDDIALRFVPEEAATWDERANPATALLRAANGALPLEPTTPRP